MKWDIPGYKWTNPSQILFSCNALRFCATPLKFEFKLAVFDIQYLLCLIWKRCHHDIKNFLRDVFYTINYELVSRITFFKNFLIK